MTAVAAYPAAVAPLIEALLDGVREALGENFVGCYLCGSLALGGFDPEASDVDVLVVTGRPVSDAEFAALEGCTSACQRRATTSRSTTMSTTSTAGRSGGSRTGRGT